jgi:hypothetical protein
VLLVDAHSFPPVLLVVKFEGSGVCRHNHVIGGSVQQLAQQSLEVLKDCNVLDVELDHLFGIVA